MEQGWEAICSQSLFGIYTGRDISGANLGIMPASWSSVTDVRTALSTVKNAIDSLRDFASNLGNAYSIIQTRQNFTDSLIDVLSTGADDLLLADMNEESANYLALQTRQQLAVNALSLASQSAQSVLSLF